MSGKASQRKGSGGERELATILRGYGYEVGRGGSLSFGEVPDLIGLPGIHIEVKRVGRLNLHGGWDKLSETPPASVMGNPPYFTGETAPRGW